MTDRCRLPDGTDVRLKVIETRHYGMSDLMSPDAETYRCYECPVCKKRYYTIEIVAECETDEFGQLKEDDNFYKQWRVVARGLGK